MFRDLSLMGKWGAFGGSYGVFLAAMGFLAAGWGHGTYVVIGLSSAPCGLAHNVIIALIGAPVFWLFAAFFAAGARHWVWLLSFLLLMSAHYVSLFWILNDPTGFGDWSYVHKVRGLFWIAIVFYCAGHLALWGLAVCQVRKRFAPRIDGNQGQHA